jgi:hypothetical protein
LWAILCLFCQTTHEEYKCTAYTACVAGVSSTCRVILLTIWTLAAAAAANFLQLPHPTHHCIVVTAGMVTTDELRQECVLPRIGRLQEVTQAVAAAVAAQAAAGTRSLLLA